MQWQILAGFSTAPWLEGVPQTSAEHNLSSSPSAYAHCRRARQCTDATSIRIWPFVTHPPSVPTQPIRHSSPSEGLVLQKAFVPTSPYIKGAPELLLIWNPGLLNRTHSGTSNALQEALCAPYCPNCRWRTKRLPAMYGIRTPLAKRGWL